MTRTERKKPGRVKTALLEWLGVPIALTDTAFWSQFGTTSAGQTVNQKSVMQLSTVWACARIIAETISTLPLKVYEKRSDSRVIATQHPIYSILHAQPNKDTTASVFWEAKIVAMLLRGNGLSEKKYIGNRLVALDFLVPARLTINRGANGKLRYLYTENGKQREIPEDRIFRIPGFTLDGKWGVSVIEYGAKVFGSALAAAEAANSTFEKGLAPTVAFTMDRVIKEDQRNKFRESMKKISGALNAGESPLLEAGMDAKTIGIPPKDAQLLESRGFSVEEICRWFRVPPHMVGHTSNSTSWGAGIEQQMIGFLTFTLRPWLTRIEQAINKDLFSPVDQQRFYAEFSIEGLLRADSKTRAEYQAIQVNNGIKTRDDVRREENLPAKGGNADVLTVQAAMTTLDSIGQIKATNENQ
ncbi:plasmid partitioning protein ParB [Advenella kashmirensis W13003]|uniref:Plasmid partitioning protein ParB n=1 Tax=Advenella kashmirensis W13003 TaxID=1424334 RepID=V8QM11_9BURK|nr:phage portal protein [Advenella kashmirensis]ETF00687.1 plasmid partitioning protein ParB [Advenella kashmirensis W13003]